ncbi:hypothetical protein HMPREF1985_00839 [Mitsuokella sp. oral taxon 131 str. W9106]|nr:hypothetical protein HMPREF1985_00839 [Mitsuokella sp. oral taxon 131 str. W9106]
MLVPSVCSSSSQNLPLFPSGRAPSWSRPNKLVMILPAYTK